MPAEVLWPERESLYDLMLLRAAIGVGAFNSEKQNDPSDPSLSEWPAEYFDWPGLWFDRWPEQLAVKTIAIDPSKGRDARRGDFSAIVQYGRTVKGVEYVEADLARRPVDRICADAAAHCAAFRPDGLALESNTFQELMCDPLRKALEAAGCSTLAITLYDNTAPKQVRIRRLTGPLAQRRVRFKSRSPGTMLLVDQLRDFPNADHDDGPDGLEMSRRKGVELWNGRRGRKGPESMRAT